MVDRGNDLAREVDRLMAKSSYCGKGKSHANKRDRLRLKLGYQWKRRHQPRFWLSVMARSRTMPLSVRRCGWFTEQRARKIIVPDLAVETTKEMNADRGVEFRLP
jgi:hypothetical protein